MKIEKNCSLLPYNTFGIDQKCDELWTYESTEEAAEAAKALQGREFLILGGGSNLLLTKDYHGIVITPSSNSYTIEKTDADADHVDVRVWSGATFDEIVALTLASGLYGLENLSLIPGEVGASAVQNIGAYGAEAKDVIRNIEAVEIASGNVVTINAEDCDYSYRQSRFKHEWKNRYLITYVTYRLSRTFRPHLDYGNIRKELERQNISEATLTGEQLRQVICDIRRAKLPDPAVTGNAGSFFMNPIVDKATFDRLLTEHPDLRYFEVKEDSETRYKIPAGWMIDQCGWKGKSLGRAGVHDKQALVLVNRGGATGEDIVRLMEAIQHDVKTHFGLDIYPEVNII